MIFVDLVAIGYWFQFIVLNIQYHSGRVTRANFMMVAILRGVTEFNPEQKIF